MRKTQASAQSGTSDSLTSAGGRLPIYNQYSSQATNKPSSRPQIPNSARSEAATAAAKALLAQPVASTTPRQQRAGNAGTHFERLRERECREEQQMNEMMQACPEKEAASQSSTPPVYRQAKFSEDLSEEETDKNHNTAEPTPVQRKGPYKQAIGDFFTPTDTLKDIKAQRELQRKGLSLDTSASSCNSSSTRDSTRIGGRPDSALQKFKNFWDPPQHPRATTPVERPGSARSGSFKGFFSRPSSSHGKAETQTTKISDSTSQSPVAPLTSTKDMWKDYKTTKDIKKQERQREVQLALAAKEKEQAAVAAVQKRLQEAQQLEAHLQKIKQEETEEEHREKAREERRKQREAANVAVNTDLPKAGDRTTRMTDFINLLAPALDEDTEPSSKSNDFLGPKLEEKGKQSSASNLFAMAKSSLGIGESSSHKAHKRRASQDSDMSFVDVGVVEMMDACRSCWKAPTGATCLKNGLCKNCR